tara:strand:+ start:2031 stop:2678 length:648 start_codon:yes stop_codon:yes gene_type:complete
MNEVEKMEMPEIIDGNNEENNDEINNETNEDSSSSSSEEEKPDIKQEDVFETPVIQKVKEKKSTIKDEIADFEEIGEIVEEYKNGDTRFDGKIYYNGRWKTQPQLDHLARMREKRWAGHVKAEKKIAQPKTPPESVKSVNFDEEVLDKVAMRAVAAYKAERKAKKEKKKKVEKTRPTTPVDIPVKEPIENYYEPIVNDIRSRLTDDELEYRDCFF